jgi:hypothetical protein
MNGSQYETFLIPYLRFFGSAKVNALSGTGTL